MIVSIPKKVIYIGVPHTGSSFFHDHVMRFYDPDTVPFQQLVTGKIYLNSAEKKHYTLSQIKKIMTTTLGVTHNSFSEFKVFCVTRNPINWILSDYSLMLQARSKWKHFKEEDIRSSYDIAKANWIVNCIKRKNWKFENHVTQMTSYYKYSIFKHYSNIQHENIEYLKFEDFERSYTKIANSLDISLPSFNVVVNKSQYNKKQFIDKKTKNMIYDNLEFDFKNFGYTIDCA